MEKTLGEGEFGLVVKARMAGTDGDRSGRNVAVKMLKRMLSVTFYWKNKMLENEIQS